jgi:hypothetical protein
LHQQEILKDTQVKRSHKTVGIFSWLLPANNNQPRNKLIWKQ